MQVFRPLSKYISKRSIRGGLQQQLLPEGVTRGPAHPQLQIQQHHCSLWGHLSGEGTQPFLNLFEAEQQPAGPTVQLTSHHSQIQEVTT